ncbi:glycoside hydrolase family 2 [Pedobacter sp. HMWF019]|uniref:glycoside hydrolase family 2 TIM barrel-domain containing protein n=1 Tax=Pedobacter sp. HMWF019 TaxID=2056856 RepID=UPI000D3887D3|nr:glycoside hydrolase family 2 TIM barrel-domain containing protein [Pedobacter sp. HMWF019]PTS92432.1 glycoside hydrolase family 2 [Pedobacter sp. HMWF019]
MSYFKQFLFFLCFLFAGAAFSQEKNLVTGRTRIGFNEHWSFSKDEKTWENIKLPHTWNAKDVMDDEPGYYRGFGWYKKELSTKPYRKGKEIFLCFEGANQETEVYVNGTLAAKHAGGYTGFNVPLHQLLKFDGDFKNEIVIKVTNRFNEDIAPLTADFTFFGGIYRKVDLLITEPIHFSLADHGAAGVYINTPLVSDEKGKVQVKSLLENASLKSKSIKLITTVYDQQGKAISSKSSRADLPSGGKITMVQDLPEVKQPHLWSPEHPYLYRVVSQILDAKDRTELDLISNSLGFRWFKFDAEKGFFLNGKPLKLVGASRHQDYEGLGNAVPESLQIRDVELIKQMGGNFLRVAHYPQDPVILQACDRLGILASVEIPVVNAITESPAFTKNCKNMLLEMIRQNFNHPSVVVWAYMNEVLLRPKFSGDKDRQHLYFEHIRELAQSLEDLTRKEDPLRYTMMAFHGDFDRYTKVGLTKIPMIVGWNLYQGWYGGELKGFGQFLDKHRKELPDKPVMVTEFGADADPRIRSFVPVRFDKSVEYALKFSQVYLNDILSRSFVSGAMVWNLADFNSETREETMPHINNKGLLTLGREPKDTYYLYQAYLLKQPFLKIASGNWTERTGMADSTNGMVSTQQIQVATNFSSAELFLNGKSLGIQFSKDHLCTWPVPFQAGWNQVRAVNPEQPGIEDVEEIRLNLLPYLITGSSDFAALHVLLGAERYFIDEQEHTLWIPDQAYRKGSWGYIGGAPFKGTNNRISYGSDKNILGTDRDPIYQTQQVGLSAYKMDVPDGTYELTLFFSELMGGPDKEALAYNLDNNHQKEIQEQRIFNVNVNGKSFLNNLNLGEDYGYATAVQKSLKINVVNGTGILLDFVPQKGKPVLNALSLRRIN